MLKDRSLWLYVKLPWIGSIACALGLGLSFGMLLTYAAGVDHPVANKPIKVDYCFLFSHEDLFRGQPVETDAHYVLGIEGAGIARKGAPRTTPCFSAPPDDDPIGKEWYKEIQRQWYPAEFNISFVGMIPAYPRYRRWYADAKDLWRGGHHVPYIQMLSLTHFDRTR